MKVFYIHAEKVEEIPSFSTNPLKEKSMVDRKL
jgi:hypothetical protein